MIMTIYLICTKCRSMASNSKKLSARPLAISRSGKAKAKQETTMTPFLCLRVFIALEDILL